MHRSGSWQICVLLCLTMVFMVLAACGGSGSSSGNDVNATQKTAATVTGVVSFPALSSLVAKQAAAAAAVVPPVFTITDLSGNVIATPSLTVDSVDPKKFTYTVSLDASKNYVFKASWGGQVLRGLADQSTLSTLTSVINVTPVSTAAVLVAEKKLNLGVGQLGTNAAGTVTAAQLGAINHAALLSAIESGKSTSYAPLVDAVTTALTSLNDPARDTAVTAAVNTAPAYTAPLSFTSAMISGKSFKDAEGSILSFKADGTLTVFKPDGVTVSKTYGWVLNLDGTIVLRGTSGWARFTLTTDNSPASLTVSNVDNSGATETSKVWTYYTPATTPTTGSVTGTYSITVSGSGNPVTATITVSANGTITGTDSQGAAITGTANTQSGAFTTTAAATATNGNSPVYSTGTINLSTGAMSGSFTVTHTDGTTETGTFSGNRTSTGTTMPGFTTAMVSGKTIYWADNAGYGYFRFTSAGTFYGTGNINLGASTESGPIAYTISNGVLNYVGNSATTATILSTNINGSYWQVQLTTGVERWFYGSNAAADAQAYFSSLSGSTTSYSNASLSGVWITSQLGTNGDPLYLVSNGAGTISDMSAFNLSTPPGTYTVNADGAYSMPFGFATFTGNLTSSTAGTVTYSGLGSNGTITKVADISKCQGSYTGTVSWGTSSYAISFSVDSTGIISSFSSNIPGVTTITSSKFFSLADGKAIFMIRTNATSVEFRQMKGWGTLVNGNFTGTLALDTNQGDGTVTLTRN